MTNFRFWPNADLRPQADKGARARPTVAAERTAIVAGSEAVCGKDGQSVPLAVYQCTYDEIRGKLNAVERGA